VRNGGSCWDPEVEGVKVAGEPESRDELASDQTQDEPVAETASSVEAAPSSADGASADLTVPDDAAAAPETAAPETAETAAPEAPETAAAAEPADEPEEEPAETAAARDDTADSEATDGSEEEKAAEEEEENVQQWYILKVQVNREESIRRALERRVKVAGLERFFGEIVIPTEDVAEYNKSGKRRIVKKKLYPGYLMIHLALNDDTWFLVRETPGIGDFTGSAGKPTPMAAHEVQRIVMATKGVEAGETPVKTAIPFKPGDRVRVKEGYFENFEGDVESIDEANGRITVMINIFGRSTPVELEHWQVESV
jgi:transcription termination/antitermination protein NusG